MFKILLSALWGGMVESIEKRCSDDSTWIIRLCNFWIWTIFAILHIVSALVSVLGPSLVFLLVCRWIAITTGYWSQNLWTPVLIIGLIFTVIGGFALWIFMVLDFVTDWHHTTKYKIQTAIHKE